MIPPRPRRALAAAALALALACEPRDTVARTGCDAPAPPAALAAWIDASWKADLSRNLSARRNWLLDSIVMGQGTVNLCVRWGATTTFTTAARDQLAASMQTWLDGWLTHLRGYGCFPYPRGVTVRIAGFAVRPGQESLLEWTDRTIPVYNETDSSSTPANEPRCPAACAFSSHWDHQFPDCPGGERSHYDYDVWLDDGVPGGGVAVGGDWGLRMRADRFTSLLGSGSSAVVQQLLGYGFGMQSYAAWAGSLPPGGALITGTAMGPPNEADGWLLRRVWTEQKALRGW